MNDRFLQLFREVFTEALSRKTGWGKNEIALLFEQSASRALALLLDEQKS